jgi:hypothetical protein
MASNEHHASRLRQAARREDARFLYRAHALDEIGNDGVSKLEVENMLRRCRVTQVELNGCDETLRAEGSDADGRPLVAIVVLYEETVVIKVITGWIRK